LAPCGYCRRCAIHDDPGGCLEVERADRFVLVSAKTGREIEFAHHRTEWDLREGEVLWNDYRPCVGSFRNQTEGDLWVRLFND